MIYNISRKCPSTEEKLTKEAVPEGTKTNNLSFSHFENLVFNFQIFKWRISHSILHSKVKWIGPPTTLGSYLPLNNKDGFCSLMIYCAAINKLLCWRQLVGKMGMALFFFIPFSNSLVLVWDRYRAFKLTQRAPQLPSTLTVLALSPELYWRY